MNRLMRLAAAALAFTASLAQAGGPLVVCTTSPSSNNQPMKYTGAGTVILNYDGGGMLGTRTKAQADAIVTSAVSLWTNVGTSSVTILRGVDLPVDVGISNYTTYLSSFSDGLNPIIYDADGSIIDDFFGVGAKSSVLGFAGSGGTFSGCRYTEGRAVINGFISITTATLTTTIAHEVGHLIGLDHTQLDNTQGLVGSNYPLMYPIVFRTLATLHEDDIAAVSTLYPDATLNSVYGQITGNFTVAGGVTAVRGANLWAREINTSVVYSIVSDYLLQNTGYFKLLLPAGTYTLRAEAISSDFEGGSSVGPYADTYPTDPSFQPPLYSSLGVPMAPVTLGNATPVQFSIIPGCAATATFNLNGTGSVTGNCVTTPSTTTIASTANPATTGQWVTFTATVSGSSGIPAGTVDFRANGTTIPGCGAVVLGAFATNSAATCSTATLVGSPVIIAVYSGGTPYAGSSSSGLTQVINTAPINASIGLATSGSPANAGASVTFTVSLFGSVGSPTGAVDFRDGATTISSCGAVAIVAGVARCTTSGLASGTHSVTARYSGSSSYLAGTSAAVSQVINAAPPPPTGTNVALASTGATATASSIYSASFPASAVINGDRAGLNWGNGSGWNDGTASTYPDWVQINFNGSKIVDRVIVYTLQDNVTSPVDPSDAMTFTSYGVKDFTVEGWNGASWVVLGTVINNNLVKRTVTFTAFTTDRIRINVTRGLGGYSHLTEVEAFGTASGSPPPTGTNVALASTGATATASSVYSASFPASAVINGDRAGLNWGNGSGWNDGTASTYPDWVRINFNGSKIVDRVVVYTLQDNVTSPVDPSDAMTFTSYGVVDFAVQGWNGSAWVDLGTVTNNNLVKRTVTFTAFTTDRIRINVTRALGGYSHITEVEAFGTASGSPPPAGSNVALASTGATATASSVYSASFPASAVINGDRAGVNWGNGSGWNDGTASAFPDWVRINFSGTRTLDRVIVYTLQDNINAPVEPSDTMTFTSYGVVDFAVQGWNGSAWVDLGTVTNNNLVKRTVNFTPFATDRIRINVTSALGGYSHITEVEAWGS